MMKQHFLFLWLLILLIVQGCATSPYQTTTPYPSKQKPQSTGEQDIFQPGSTEPSEQPTGQMKSPLVNNISQQADQQMRNGQLKAAAQTLERGLRIAPKSAFLWSQLADIRLRQHHYGQALTLAAKSNSLAGGEVTIIRRNERIIEEAQKKQK